MGELEKQEAIDAMMQGREIRPLRMILTRELINPNSSIHPGRLNVPTVGEIAAIFLDSNDGQPPKDIDVVVYPKHFPNRNMHRISHLSANCDPLCYPLLFPYGEPGDFLKFIRIKCIYIINF